jgi:hypothetical protein
VKLEGFIDGFFIIQPAYSEAEFGRLTTSWRPRSETPTSASTAISAEERAAQ